ncbi:MAG: diaminobutyrate acetyltransferase [Hyphomonadaceae bacterium]
MSLERPRAEDGAEVSGLIARCPPLDCNSAYCNLLQCTDFAGTCVVARRAGRVVGWVSGYRPPAERGTLFIWQVAVDPAVRGARLGERMIRAIFARPEQSGATRIRTTITQENESSWRLFRRVAANLGAPFEAEPWFLHHSHFAGRHDTEHMVTIGPIPAAA